jgi:pyruvate ferredoxin oxidoreductase alpha subunit
LGGRPITKASLRKLFDRADSGHLEPFDYLDLKTQLVTA